MIKKQGNIMFPLKKKKKNSQYYFKIGTPENV